MSRRGLPNRAHICRLLQRGGEVPAGAIRRILLVGKQSTISERNTSGSISIPVKWASILGHFHRVGSFPNSPEQDTDLGRSLRAGQIRSAVLRLRRSNCKTLAARFSHNLFGCNDFSSGVCYKTLTKGSSERNMPPHRRRWRCVASAEMSTGCIPAPLTKSGEV